MLTPYYDLAETSSQVANLQWRIKLRKAALYDTDLQNTIRQACEEDILFFFAFALWLIEPRGEDTDLPFLPWPHQVEAIVAVEEAIKDSRASMEDMIDLLVDKSRAQGASYIVLGVDLKHYLFDRMFSVSLISRNMDCVDNARDPDSLMYKIDYLMDRLPFWLRPKGTSPPSADKRQRLINEHSWTNPELSSSMVGYAATGDVGSGGRKTVCLFDEVAKFDEQRPGMAQEAMDSTAYTTNCRQLVSTHKGDYGVYFDMIFDHKWTPISKVFPWGGSGVYTNGVGGIKIVLDWRDNPQQNRLAYRASKGLIIPERPEEAKEVFAYIDQLKKSGNWAKLIRKGFIKDGRLRSRWYDNRCFQQRATPRSIAQELDRDPRGTVGKMFNTEVMDEMDKTQIKPPVWQGDAIVRDGGLHLSQEEGGPLKLWFMPGLNGSQPPKGSYVVSADPGTGIESEESGNSTICGGDATTGEQVFEFCKQLPESKLADLAVALSEWLFDAFLIWEAQGSCGKRFNIRVISEIAYWNIWKRPSVILHGKPRNRINPDVLGWVNNKTADKRDLFEDLWIAMQEGKFIPRSAEMILECRGWEEKPSKTAAKTEVIYHGTGHGDRAIAAGLCWKGMKTLEFSIDKSKKDAHNPENSFSMGGRLALRQAAEKQREDDDFLGFGFGLAPELADERW